MKIPMGWVAVWSLLPLVVAALLAGCDPGVVNQDSCEGISCQTPPENECISADTIRVYDGSPGVCQQGSCQYSHEDRFCAQGCLNGQCQGCVPVCGNKCGGAGDGCGGTCSGACPSGQWCSGQMCAVCNDDAHCGAACAACASQGNNRACVSGQCGCRNESDCATGEQCQEGACTGCQPDCQGKCGGAGDGCNGACASDCPVSQWCSTQACSPCDVDAHCGASCTNCAAQLSNKRCLTTPIDQCGCQEINDCDTGEACVNAACCLAPHFTTQPTNRAVCAGAVATFTAAASSAATPTYQWQVSTDGGGTWANLSNGGVYSGAASASLTVTGATEGMNNTQYRLLVSNGCGSTTSNQATLAVNTVPAQPSEITGTTTTCEGTSQNYSVTNVGGVTYTWTFPSDWSQTGGGTSSSITVVVGADSGNVRVVPSNGCGSGAERTLATTVNILSTEPTGIDATANPICLGNATTLTPQGGTMGTGASYQWFAGSCGGAVLDTGATYTAQPNSTTAYFVRRTGTCNTTSCATIVVNIPTCDLGTYCLDGACVTPCFPNCDGHNPGDSDGCGGTCDNLLSGTFLNAACRQTSRESYGNQLDELKALHMSTLILAGLSQVKHPSGCTNWNCCTFERWTSDAVLQWMLDDAAARGIEIYLTIAECSSQANPPVYPPDDPLKTACVNHGLDLVNDFKQTFGSHPAFRGYYVNVEAFVGYGAGDYAWYNNLFTPVIHNTHQADPGRPVIAGGYMYPTIPGHTCTPAQLGTWVGNFVSGNNLDIFLLQDGVGSFDNSFLQSPTFSDYFTEAKAHASPKRFWGDIELFQWSAAKQNAANDNWYHPANISRINEQLYLATATAERRISYINEHHLTNYFCSWGSNYEMEAAHLWRGYRAMYFDGTYYRSGVTYGLTPDASAQYPDSNHRLFDGLEGQASWADWVGWWVTSGAVEILFDLGSQKPVRDVTAVVRTETNAAIYYPTRMDVDVSADGVSFSPLGSFINPYLDQPTYSKAYLWVGSSAEIPSRYVKVTLTPPAHGSWLFVSELEIYSQ